MQPLTPNSTTIALMDRCSLTLVGLSSFIEGLNAPSQIVVQETSISAVSEALLYQPTDILITELSGLNETIAEGRKKLLELCVQLPSLRVIVYTRCQAGDELKALLEQVNISVIARDDTLPQVGEFFTRVFDGERVLSPLIGTCLARNDSEEIYNLHHLTRCENDVLTFLFNGMSLRQIAELQRRSIKTISAHKCNAMRKLQVKNDSELFSLKKNITQQFVVSE